MQRNKSSLQALVVNFLLNGLFGWVSKNRSFSSVPAHTNINGNNFWVLLELMRSFIRILIFCSVHCHRIFAIILFVLLIPIVWLILAKELPDLLQVDSISNVWNIPFTTWSDGCLFEIMGSKLKLFLTLVMSGFLLASS